MKEELLPCPFCGRKPCIIDDGKTECGCWNTSCVLFEHGMSIDNWQSRPTPTGLRELDKQSLAEFLQKYFGIAEVHAKTDIYKDEKMAELVGKTVNWYMTHGLAENICAHFAAKMGEPGLRAWEDEEELAKELRWLDSGDIDKEYKEKYWDACKDKEFYREKAKAIFGRGNFARPVVSVEQIATILTKCKSIFKNPHHYSMDEQGKMVMDDARLIHDLHNRSGWHIRRCEICGLVYQYDTSD